MSPTILLKTIPCLYSTILEQVALDFSPEHPFLGISPNKYSSVICIALDCYSNYIYYICENMHVFKNESTAKMQGQFVTYVPIKFTPDILNIMQINMVTYNFVILDSVI